MGEPGVTVCRLRNRQALFLPEIDELFRVSLKDFDDHDHVDVWSWVGAFLPDPDIAIFVARVDDDWSGLAVVDGRMGVWCPDPSVLFLYAGAPGVFDALVGAIREFCEPKSSRFRFVNGTNHSDAAYLRKLRRWCSGNPWGTLIECTWADEGDEQ